MNKGTIICGIAAALLGSGLLWAADSKEEVGISGWKTLNVSMEQAIGNSDSETKANTLAVETNNSSTDTKQGTGQANKTAVAQGAEKSVPAISGAEAGGTVADANPPLTTTEPATPASPTTSAAPAVTQEGMVNVNTAASAELMNLPGIGEKKAQAIIDYRSSNGPFHSLSDLGKVKGIGTKMLEKLKALVLF